MGKVTGQEIQTAVEVKGKIFYKYDVSKNMRDIQGYTLIESSNIDKYSHKMLEEVNKETGIKKDSAETNARRNNKRK